MIVEVMMDRKMQWRRQLDSLLTQLASQLKVDLYDNVVVPVVQDWFACWDSVSQLNKNIEQRLIEAWPTAQRKIEAAFVEFESELEADLCQGRGIAAATVLRLDAAEAQISTAVADVVSAIVVVMAGVVSGGAGMHLISTGPVGWVLGAIIGAIVLVLGRGTVQKTVQNLLKDRELPPLLKRPAKSKIATELTLNAPKFEERLLMTLKDQSAPLYEALEKISD